MDFFDKIDSAIEKVNSAKGKLLGAGSGNGGGGGGITGWLGDKVDAGWERIPGSDFVEDKVGDTVDFVNDVVDDPKGAVTDAVTATAEFTSSGYNRLQDLAADHPRVANLIEGGSNFFIDKIGGVAEYGIDKNPETMGWGDLGAIWLLEVDNVGEDGTIVFGPNDHTTIDLQTQEGVMDARAEVIQNINTGNLEDGRSSWTYGVDGYYDSLKEQNAATIFLGSYGTSYAIEDNGNGTYTVNYTVNNTTSWESGTRFRVDNDGDGVHDGIIPNKDTGDGLHLGGTVSQRWEWSETITQEELENG